MHLSSSTVSALPLVLLTTAFLYLTTSFRSCEGQLIQLGGCPYIPAFKGLNLSQYRGVWYESARIFFIPELTSTCVSVEYDPGDLKSGVPVKEMGTTIRFTEEFSSIQHFFPGRTVFLDPDLPDGTKTGNVQLTLEPLRPMAPHSLSFGVPYNYKLIYTDYTNYTLKWSCVTVPPFHIRAAWILTRERKYSHETKVAIENKLREFGISNSIFMHPNCADNKKKLFDSAEDYFDKEDSALNGAR